MRTKAVVFVLLLTAVAAGAATSIVQKSISQPHGTLTFSDGTPNGKLFLTIGFTALTDCLIGTALLLLGFNVAIPEFVNRDIFLVPKRNVNAIALLLLAFLLPLCGRAYAVDLKRDLNMAIIWGFYGNGGTVAQDNALIASTGQKFTTKESYVGQPGQGGWAGWNSNLDYELSQNVSVIPPSAGGQPMVAISPMMSGDATTTFNDINSGAHDGDFNYLFQRYAAAGYKEMSIRPLWEFNLGAVNSGNQQAFIQAFQHIADLAHNNPYGIKVDVIWNPGAGNTDPIPYYPGDQYVDWVGIDESAGFGNQGNYTDPLDLNISDYMIGGAAAFAVQHNKPLAVCEGGVASGGYTQWLGNIQTALNETGAKLALYGFYDATDTGADERWQIDQPDINAVINFIQNAPAWTGGATGGGSGGTPSPNGTTITSASAPPIIDASGNAWSLVQSASRGLQIAINGTVDAVTQNVLLLEYLNGAMVQQSIYGWYSETQPNDSWVQISNPNPTPTAPVVSSITTAPGSGDLTVGASVTLTVTFSSAVTVAGGTPTLALNDGGTASYVSGSGSNALVFKYTVAAGQNTADLALAASNAIALNGATIRDASGNNAVLTAANGYVPAGTLQIDTTAPTVSAITTTPGSGPVMTGGTVTLTMTFSEAVTVAGGTPTLALNDGGTATYTSGSGSNALVFKYAVAAGQSTADLALAASNAVALNGATIRDGAGNNAVLTAANGYAPAGTLMVNPTPSPDGTMITSASAPPIIDASGNAWSLVQSASQGLQIAINGTVDAVTQNVLLLEYLNGAMVQQSIYGWYSETQPNDSWVQIANPNPSQPPPAAGNVTIGSGSDTLVLSISEDAWANGDGTSNAQGDAAFTVAVDGKQLAGTFFAHALHSAGASQTFTFKGDWAPGAHTVTASFLNDAWGGTASTDRNLYVNDITYDGTDTRQSATLNTTGSHDFSVTDSTALPPPLAGAGQDLLLLEVSEDYYLGNAQFTVSVDGKPLGGTFTATTLHSSGSYQTFAFAGDFGSGTHTVSVKFLNDAYGGSPSKDRNLYVNDIIYNGTDTKQSRVLATTGAKNFSVSGGTTPSVSETSDHGSLQKNLAQTGSYAVGGDSFVLSSNNAVSVTLGTGVSRIGFIGASAVAFTGGPGEATVTADTGNNKFVAGAGSLDVTGGAGKDAFVFHATSGVLTVEDFSLAKGDTLTIDKSLQGSLHQATDGMGGTMLTFGTAGHGVDLHGVAGLSNSGIMWA